MKTPFEELQLIANLNSTAIRRSKVALWLSIASLLFSIGCALVGCAAPVTRSLAMSQPPDAAYVRAREALQQMGAVIATSDSQQRILSGTVKNAVVLNVAVSSTATGSVVLVQGRVLADKIALGSVTEVDDYLDLLR
jgi:hypothetical protein